MLEPIARAKWVLESKGINDIPALALADIAMSESIGYKFADYPVDSWDGTLLFKGDQRAILVNTHRGNAGKNNFTFAHELGHYFLDHKPNFNQDGQLIIRCTATDIESGQKPREVEANRFAVELLMPEGNFRLGMAGAPIDFELINSLSRSYMVSKHACSNRIVALTQAPCIVIRTSGTNITSIAVSRSAKGFLRSMKTLPMGTIAYTAITENRWGNNFTVIESEKWLCRTIPGESVFECTHMHKDSGTAMTIIKW